MKVLKVVLSIAAFAMLSAAHAEGSSCPGIPNNNGNIGQVVTGEKFQLAIPAAPAPTIPSTTTSTPFATH